MQNLNLYQPGERVTQRGPQLPHVIAAFALMFVALVVHAGIQLWQASALETRLANANAAAQMAEAELAAVSANFVAPVLDAGLPPQVAERQAANAQLSRLEHYLVGLEDQRIAGFAGVLKALADQHPSSGLWLTAISLRQGGVDMRLQGLSQTQTLLPVYLDSLGRNPILAGRQFAQFAVERDPSGLFGFSLDSRAAENKP